MMKRFRYILLKILPAAGKAARRYGGGMPGFSGKTQALMVSVIKCRCYSGGRVIEPPGILWDHAACGALIPNGKPHGTIESSFRDE
jgi:hypothetical protein